VGFDAGNAVEPLDFDFSAFVEDCKGTIPEPSQGALERFFDATREIGTQAGVAALEQASSASEVAGALATASEDVLDALTDKLVVAVADLCSGTPSLEQIQQLPFRVRQAFIDWLLGEITDPTKLNPASRDSLAHSNGAAGRI